MTSASELERPKPVDRLVESVLRSAGVTAAPLRRAVADRAAELFGAQPAPAELPAELLSYVDKVARNAYRVTDEDIEALRAAGHGEDEIFELTVSAALGASLARFEHGLRLLREAGS